MSFLVGMMSLLSTFQLTRSTVYTLYTLNNTIPKYGEMVTSGSRIQCSAECNQREECYIFFYSRRTESCSLARKCFNPLLLIEVNSEEFNGEDYVYGNLDNYSPTIRHDLARGEL